MMCINMHTPQENLVDQFGSARACEVDKSFSFLNFPVKIVL